MTLPVSAFIAANRFGLGAAPGELAAASIDPRAWLKSQLAGTPETPAALADLSDSADVLVELISKGPAAKAMRIQSWLPGRFRQARARHPRSPADRSLSS